MRSQIGHFTQSYWVEFEHLQNKGDWTQRNRKLQKLINRTPAGKCFNVNVVCFEDARTHYTWVESLCFSLLSWKSLIYYHELRVCFNFSPAFVLFFSSIWLVKSILLVFSEEHRLRNKGSGSTSAIVCSFKGENFSESYHCIFTARKRKRELETTLKMR